MDINSPILIIAILIGLVVVWFVLRSVLRLTSRIFSCGCSVIVVIGILLIVWRVLNGS
jgi:hypothetical protein